MFFSKQSKFVSPSVSSVFQDKFVFRFASFKVRLPVTNQNLAMDLAHQNQYMGR